MTSKEVVALAQQINKDGGVVTGYRLQDGSYTLECRCPRTGIPYRVFDPADHAFRHRDAEAFEAWMREREERKQ